MTYMTSLDALPPCPAQWEPPEGFEPDFSRNAVWLGSEPQSFLKGHSLSVAELLDALDGFTERVWTTDTHTLVLRRHGEAFRFSDPEVRITLEADDSFTAEELR
jgi:hypothetical protein